MANPELGTKQICPNCQAKFYDLGKRPAHCPKCAHDFDPDEAVRAHLDLGARTSVGTHYGCFQLTDEGIDEPLRALEAACRLHGVSRARFRALETGETLRLDRGPS